MVCGLFLSATPFHAAAKKKKAPAAAPVSAAARARALNKVDQYLADSAGNTLEQAGALAPAMEAFFRLSSGASRDPSTFRASAIPVPRPASGPAGGIEAAIS